MNTPRTRALKRWSPPLHGKMLHRGGATWGITNPAFGAEFGYLVSYWWHVEEQMIGLLDELLTGEARNGEAYPFDLSARQVFRSITSQDGRIKLMRRLLETSARNAGKDISYDQLIDEFENLNGIRNRYVHGIWVTDAETGAVHLRKATSQHEIYEPSVAIDLAEIVGVRSRMGKLYEMVALRHQKPQSS